MLRFLFTTSLDPLLWHQNFELRESRTVEPMIEREQRQGGVKRVGADHEVGKDARRASCTCLVSHELVRRSLVQALRPLFERVYDLLDLSLVNLV